MLHELFINHFASVCNTGGIVLSVSLIYPVRMVKELALLRSGNSVRIVTYDHLKGSRHLLVPMEKLSCAVDRDTAQVYVIIKVADKWFGFLLDKRAGTFLEPELFDRAIGRYKWK